MFSLPKQGRLGRSSGSALAAIIFAAATNRTNIHKTQDKQAITQSSRIDVYGCITQGRQDM